MNVVYFVPSLQGMTEHKILRLKFAKTEFIEIDVERFARCDEINFFFYEGNETGLDVMQRTTFENHQSSVYVYVSIPFLRASPFIRWWIYAKQMLIIFQIFERNTSHVLQFPLLSLCVHILIAIQNWTGCEINSSKMSVFYSRMNAFARTAIYTQTHPLRMWHSTVCTCT